MFEKRACLALGLVCALGMAAFAGQPAAPAAAEGDIFDELKKVEACGIQFKFGGEARLRYEWWHDFNINEYQPRWYTFGRRGGRSDGMVLSRVRLSVEAQVTEQISFFVEGQDARTWDYDGPKIDTGTIEYDPFADHLDWRQAYAVFKLELGGLPVHLKVGRTELDLGDGRMQGNNWWHNTPEVFDAVAVILPLEPVTIVGWVGKAVVMPDTRSFNHVNPAFDYWGLYTMWNVKQVNGLDKLDVYLLHLRDDRDDFMSFAGFYEGPMYVPGELKLYAFGVLAKGHLGDENLKWEIEHVQEFGTLSENRIRAWALHVLLGYTLADCMWTPTLYVEHNRATGDSDPYDSTSETFIPFFPNIHNMYGLMDLFAWSNMHQYKLGCKVQPAERLSIEVGGSIFYLDRGEDAWVTSRGGVEQGHPAGARTSNSEHVGEEVDILIKYEANERTSMEAGYGHFFDGGFIQNTSFGGCGGADFFYAMTTFRF